MEAAINSVPEVHEAAAVLQDAGKPTAALIAYVSPATVETSVVAAACANALPHYMVPSAVVCLDVLPRLSNGKIDRKSLPRHTFSSSAAYVRPSDEVERVVQSAWQEVLSHINDPISMNDNFFAVRE